ncbi:MAG: HAD family phosphatase [Candidatus Saccharibacteria bacterium]|nr:HAD family phosphatase [Candidatus Saccharibacteria bacterium]
MKRKFAAFDIDGTISRNALFLQIVDELIARGNLPKDYRSSLDSKFEEYKKRKHKNSFKDYMMLSVNILLDNLNSISVQDYRKAVDAVIAKNSDYLYVYTTDLIEKLRAQGYFLIALSGSEMYSVQKFTEKLGFDLAIGEYYHEKEGFFTGKIDHVFKQKDIFLKKFIIEHDLTLEGSYAVGDSSGDLSMLRIVDNPVAFNPEDTLYEEAKKQGWKIVVERKNVIYQLEPKSGTYILA